MVDAAEDFLEFFLHHAVVDGRSQVQQDERASVDAVADDAGGGAVAAGGEQQHEGGDAEGCADAVGEGVEAFFDD